MAPAYVWGWVVVTLAASGLLFALQRALRGWEAPLLKALAGCWLLVILLVPAQVPRHNEELAPAIVVYVFEALFQRDGNPDPAGRILAAASALALVLGLLWWLVGRFRRGRADAA